MEKQSTNKKPPPRVVKLDLEFSQPSRAEGTTEPNINEPLQMSLRVPNNSISAAPSDKYSGITINLSQEVRDTLMAMQRVSE
jgi:hypothetical protein